MNIEGKQILVLDSGFVYVGDCEIQDGFVVLHNASNVRRWGTKLGLGQLRFGPTSETVADKAGMIIVPIARINHFIPVEKGW